MEKFIEPKFHVKIHYKTFFQKQGETVG